MPDSPAAEFQSYLFFLRHFRLLIHQGRAGELVRTIVGAQAPLITHLQPRPPDQNGRREIRKYLFTAWNAEAVARLSGLLDPEIRQFTNQWKPVQCYYAIYFHLVTLHFASNSRVLRRHEQTLRWATGTILRWFPTPWSLQLDSQAGAHNFPAGTPHRAPGGWNLGNNEPNLFVANFFRRTAERDRHDEWRDNYKGNNKRRLAEGPLRGRMYRVADVPLRAVSLFDVLWRFRRWANYLEADTIIEGGQFQPHAIEFDTCFNELTETTAVLFENILCRYVGRLVLDALYNEFLELSRDRLDTSALQRRRAVTCAVAP